MKNDASSYIDLSPLYGSTEADVNSVRRERIQSLSKRSFETLTWTLRYILGHDGTGRLWEDVFADRRLLFMTPSTCALLVLFCRNHNVSLFCMQMPFLPDDGSM